MKQTVYHFQKQGLALLLFVLCGTTALQAQTVPSPQQTDQIITDPNGNSKADPGDKIRYKVTIQNTGGATATGTTLNAVPDAKTTFTAGSFRSSPLAIDDGPYTCLGNVGITVPDGASDLLANDFDDTPAGLTATAGTFATTQGGSITIAANGSFSYNPPRGFEGTDTYQYTLNDGNAVAGVTATDLGTVTFTVSGMIWFINNNAGACASSCDGRMSNPYTTLAAFNTANALAGGLNPDDNDNIFVYESAAAYTSGIVLRNGQRLIGQDATVTLAVALGLILPTFSNALPVTNSANGTKVTITNATPGGHGISLASNTTTRGLTVGASAAFAIYDNGALATTTTISEVDINNSTGGGFRAFQDVLSVTFGTFTAAGGTNALNLASTGGSFAVTGTTTASGQSSDAILINAILLGSTVTFGVTSVTATGANQAIAITNNIGSVSFAAGSSVTGSSDDEIFVNGGSGNITYNGSVTNTSGGAIRVTARTSGTVAFTGNISHTGATTCIDVNGNFVATINFSGASKSINSGSATAVSLTSNTGAFINFTGGGLAITTTSGTGFNATGGGTVTVQGTGNTITSTTGTALNVNATAIGASGLTFQSISANGGTAAGIILNTTGTSGGLTVTGDGSNTTKGGNASGGTIANKDDGGTDDSGTVGTAIFLNNTSNVVLRRMQINDCKNFGIRGLDVGNFTFQYSTVNGANGDNTVGTEGSIGFGTSVPSAANGFKNGATALIDNCIVRGGVENNIEFYNVANTFSTTISNCNITNNTVATGNDGILIELHTDSNAGTPAANGTFSIQNCLFDDNKSQAVQANALGDATIDITINGCTLQRTSQGNEGFVLQNGTDGQLVAHVTNNNSTGIGGVIIFVGQVALNTTSASSLTAVISGNTITHPASALNIAIGAFLSSTVGQIAPANILIQNNTVTENSTNGVSRGILVDTPDNTSTPSFTATVINNTVSVGDNITGVQGIVCQARRGTGCFDVRSNTVTFPNGTPAGVVGLRVRQVSPGAANLERGTALLANPPLTVLNTNNPGTTNEVIGTVTVVENNTCQTPPN